MSPLFSKCAGSTLVSASFVMGTEAAKSGSLTQGDRTNLIILLPRSKIGSPVTNEAGLEPDTWARAPRWRAWQAAPPRWHGHPDGLRSAHLGSSPLVRGSWWRPQRRRCATGSVVLLGWCDHPVGAGSVTHRAGATAWPNKSESRPPVLCSLNIGHVLANCVHAGHPS